jgi:hypothetical protein
LAQESGREGAEVGCVKFGRLPRIDRHGTYISQNLFHQESRT